MSTKKKSLGIGATRNFKIQSRRASQQYRKRKKDNQEFIEKKKRHNKRYNDKLKIKIKKKEIELELAQTKIEKLTLKCQKLKTANMNVETQLSIIDDYTIIVESSSNGQTWTIEDKLLESNDLLKQNCGLNCEEFNQLLNRIANSYQEYTFAGQKRKRIRKEESPHSLQKILILTLIWLRQYPHMCLLSLLFNIHARTLIKYIRRMICALAECLENEIQWPSEPQWQIHIENFNKWLPLMPYPDLKNCICVVDGSEIKIKRPSIEPDQTEVYSAKKKQHSMNFLLIVLLNGVIIKFSAPDRGSNDQSLWNREQYRQLFESKPYGILGDGGFHFNRKFDTTPIQGATPQAKPRKSKKNPTPQLTEVDKLRNKTISQYRVIVENTLSHIKRWKIIGGKYRHFTTKKPIQQINFEKVVFVCGALANMKIRRKPLRSDNWHLAMKANANVDQMTCQLKNLLKLV